MTFQPVLTGILTQHRFSLLVLHPIRVPHGPSFPWTSDTRFLPASVCPCLSTLAASRFPHTIKKAVNFSRVSCWKIQTWTEHMRSCLKHIFYMPLVSGLWNIAVCSMLFHAVVSVNMETLSQSGDRSRAGSHEHTSGLMWWCFHRRSSHVWFSYQLPSVPWRTRSSWSRIRSDMSF